MRILIACEFSGVIRNKFRELGHEAWSCDLLPAKDGSKYHIQGDVLDILDSGWAMMIAHPPCTFMCNSGVCHLHTDPNRWNELKDAWQFFNKLKSANIHKICLENPVPHKYAREHIGKYDQIVQPYQFGHLERKATCLWLKNLPSLKATKNVYKEMKLLPKKKQHRINYMAPSKDRAMMRSITFEGIATAMADQWGKK